MHPKDLSIQDFTYELPQDRIALFPAHPRDSSKLLVSDRGNISQDIFKNIALHLPKNSTLVFNDTKVIKSRILFKKDTGATIEIFCLEPFEKYINYDTLFQQKESSLWKCMIGKAGKWKEKQLKKSLQIEGEEITLTAELQERLIDSYVVKFSWEPGEFTLGDVLNAAGVTPLPPYIKRASNKEDEETYQTIYSRHDGSVAAPTAGLHFTEGIMDSLHQRGIKTLFTTLHVGAGTFKPVKSETMAGHVMHAEWMYITLNFLDDLSDNIHKKIITVGTTSMRTLESIYRMGNKIINDSISDAESLKVTQWEAYDDQKMNEAGECIAALKLWIQNRHEDHLLIQTEIIIAPGYRFGIVSGLITNFHQPKSTLLLLVAAMVGDSWKKIYQYALDNEFRFLSYGDGCLIL